MRAAWERIMSGGRGRGGAGGWCGCLPVVRHCEELRVPHRDPADAPPPERVLPEHPSDIWTLRAWYPGAAYAAYNGDPMLIFWDFELC
jgi:hypothetical protein